MDITLPTVPAGVLTLLALAAPFVQAIIQRPSWSPAVKKVLAVVLAIVLTAVVLAFYYVYTGEVIPAWPAMVLLAIGVAQVSYTLVTKSPASAIERRINPGLSLRRDLRDRP